MKKILIAVFIGLIVIGVLTVIASIVVPMLSTPHLEEPVALIGVNEEQMRELYNDLYGLDNHGLWIALGIAGGIVAVIGAVPLIVMAVLKNVK